MSKYLKELNFIKDQIKNIYAELTNNFSLNIYDKSKYDEVTNLDLIIEKKLIERIKSFEPDAKFLSEEFNKDTIKKDKTWIIDPIDGTCNLTHSIFNYGIQCAFFDKGQIQFSVIYLPFLDELYTAIKGNGAYLNGEKINRKTREVKRSLISFGDFNHDNVELLELEQKIMNHVSKVVERVRMYGAASIDFAYCASGRLDGNFTFVNNSWDVAPGILLCKEAGLLVTDALGNEYSSDSATLAVFSTNELKDQCLSFNFS